MSNRRLGPPSLTGTRHNASGSIFVDVPDQSIILSQRPFTAYVVKVSLSSTEFEIRIRILEGYLVFNTHDPEFQAFVRKLAVMAVTKLKDTLEIKNVAQFLQNQLPDVYNDHSSAGFNPDHPDQGFLGFTYELS